MSGRWADSSRRARLPPDWPKRVALTKARAGGRCEADTHAPGCNGIGAECDHHERGDDHSLGNLRWLSQPCHTAKTQREAAAGRRARRAQARRAPRPHPIDLV